MLSGEHAVARGAVPRNQTPQSPATRRPEDLRVTPWYLEDRPSEGSPGACDRGSYPSRYAYTDGARSDQASTRNSSVEGEAPRSAPGAPRKAYMDLRDAIAMLDETCPNQEPSPSLTPRTPRTPLTPYPRNKRARSKSSDNSANYSNDRLSDRSVEPTRVHEKEKKRPFLRKIGISKTEDRPFLSKFAPRIIGKPYLEKIGPSKAVERPFLDKIGSSKTLDKFTFDTPRGERRTPISRVSREVQPESLREEREQQQLPPESARLKEARERRETFADRRRSGKEYLLKMYSFETEDLEVAKAEKPRTKMNMRQAESLGDPVRASSSSDDLLESGPSSLPPLENSVGARTATSELQSKSKSVAELVKCRITSSEEIISSSSCLDSPAGSTFTGVLGAASPANWANSPGARMASKSRRDGCSSTSDTVTPISPTKRRISRVSQEEDGGGDASDIVFGGRDTTEASPSKTRRQASEDLLDKMDDRSRRSVDVLVGEDRLERRGISSDNLKLAREAFAGPVTTGASGFRYQSQEIWQEHGRGQSVAAKEVSSISQDFSKEMFKQLHSKFELQSVPAESYATYKRTTRANFQERRILREVATSSSTVMSHEALPVENKSRGDGHSPFESRRENEPKVTATTTATEASESSDRSVTVRALPKKQESLDNQSDQETDTRSLRRPKLRIFHEPSQETMDLLTELRKVKSLLKNPSPEREVDAEEPRPARLPKKILLTDKEFCLSIERENSMRRPTKLNVKGAMTKSHRDREEGQQDEEEASWRENVEKDDNHSQRYQALPGPALFEKRCLSLDYADDDRHNQKPEARAISLASARSPPSETEETIDSSELALICDSKSYCSDVFNTPSEETDVKEIKTLGAPSNRGDAGAAESEERGTNLCAEVDIAIPVDQSSSPKRRVQIQGRTSDLYEIISPRSTPFRVKKRLGRISVEESVKQESFTLDKVDCRSVAVQKRTKCFPL